MTDWTDSLDGAIEQKKRIATEKIQVLIKDGYTPGDASHKVFMDNMDHLDRLLFQLEAIKHHSTMLAGLVTEYESKYPGYKSPGRGVVSMVYLRKQQEYAAQGQRIPYPKELVYEILDESRTSPKLKPGDLEGHPVWQKFLDLQKMLQARVDEQCQKD